MSLNSTPSAERPHIGIFGRRNAGKSSIINAITGQELAIVSSVEGTTTDPVYKAMELLPLGPVMLIDTPGLDDEGELGTLRVQKSYQVLNKTDIAVVVVDGTADAFPEDDAIIRRCREKEIPVIVAVNKLDLAKDTDAYRRRPPAPDAVWVSAATGENVGLLKEKIAAAVPADKPELRLVGDLIHPSDFVVLVVPIDKAAPKGRLILPQQQVIRDVLESDATAVVCKEYELRETLERLGKRPSLVVTDSQVFAKASADTPPDIPLTSFSILFARRKGILSAAVEGVRAVDSLREGDHVLVCEGCTHHRQCDDIGTVKIPRWMGEYTGVRPQFTFCSGASFPDDLTPYKLVIHCGGCMLPEREVTYRMRCAAEQGVPMTNYGILIAYMQGILRRSVRPFPAVACLLEEEA